MSGDFAELWMQAANGDQYEPGEMPAGAYTVYARFTPGGEKVIAALVDVEPNRAVQLRCASQFLKCRQR